jgi:hypothetical protein
MEIQIMKLIAENGIMVVLSWITIYILKKLFDNFLKEQNTKLSEIVEAIKKLAINSRKTVLSTQDCFWIFERTLWDHI